MRTICAAPENGGSCSPNKLAMAGGTKRPCGGGRTLLQATQVITALQHPEERLAPSDRGQAGARPEAPLLPPRTPRKWCGPSNALEPSFGAVSDTSSSGLSPAPLTSPFSTSHPARGRSESRSQAGLRPSSPGEKPTHQQHKRAAQKSSCRARLRGCQRWPRAVAPPPARVLRAGGRRAPAAHPAASADKADEGGGGGELTARQPGSEAAVRATRFRALKLKPKRASITTSYLHAVRTLSSSASPGHSPSDRRRSVSLSRQSLVYRARARLSRSGDASTSSAVLNGSPSDVHWVTRPLYRGLWIGGQICVLGGDFRARVIGRGGRGKGARRCHIPHLSVGFG